METEKLYYQNAFLRRFDAAVLSCTPVKNGFAVVLDRTAFYPEGGGQPADHGTIGGAAVTDVHEKDGVIIHTCASPLTPGEPVTGEIDWARRFDFMQQHSGEHIVSGLIHAQYGYDNVGFHLGADAVTIDFNGPLSPEQLADIERRANERIWADEPVECFWPDAEALAALPFRSKKALAGAVRIVRFPDADVCACCGTHVLRAGQIGVVKLLGCEKFRDGVRLELVCGARALERLSAEREQNLQVSRLLSAKPSETAAAAARMQEELMSAKARAAALEDESFRRRADELRGKGDTLLFEAAMPPDALRRLADAVGSSCGGRCAVFSGADEDWKYALVDHERDLRDLTARLNAALCGRGGGRNGLAQGSVRASREAIQAFFLA
ncbi:MAG TPA: alanine--tRNA ligase-related protein [Oscillospiraceae bacterium]|nr:alanine--tRNA ligase-related protein [Oscillospiraceae bacterium]